MIDAEGYQVLCANCKEEIKMREYSVAEVQ